MEKPSSLLVQACLYSDFMHSCAAKFLVAITTNGTLPWIYPTYGGRTSNVFIVQTSGFLDLLERGYQVITNRDFNKKHI